MATDRDDTFGYRHGAKGIDGNKTDDFKMPKSDCSFGVEDDYGAGAVSHRLSSLVEDGAADGDLGASLQSEYWKPGPINRVGDNARPTPKGYHSTQPVDPISHTSKGQRHNFGKKSADKWQE